MDRKLEMFFDKSIWEEMINHAVEKKLNLEVITKLCEPRYRVILADAIEKCQYNVAPPHIGEIPKDDGGVRKVFINEDIDRLVLSIINVIYSRLYKGKIHPNCVSYQKGLGVSKIVKSVSAKVSKMNGICGYKLDISKYFDSISRECLYQCLDELDTGSPIDAIVQKYYREDLIIDENDEVIKYYKAIAQGCPVSPFFANYCLRDIDEEISRYNVIYYRYSDDMLIIGEDADAALERLKAMLREKGLSLNPKKIEPIENGQWFTFLGFRINGDKISFSKKSLKNFQREIKLLTQPHKGDQKALDSAIRNIQYYLYTAFIKSKENFGWGEYFFSTVNIEEDIIELDKFVKDRLKGMYSGKIHVGGLGVSNIPKRGVAVRTGVHIDTNQFRVSNDFLRDHGYISMHHMYNLYRVNKEVYRNEISRKMM